MWIAEDMAVIIAVLSVLIPAGSYFLGYALGYRSGCKDTEKHQSGLYRYNKGRPF